MPFRTPHSRDLRRHRFLASEIAYSVTTTVIDRAPLLGPTEGRIVISTLDWLRQRGRVLLFGFVVMPDHIHVLLMPMEGALPEVMKSLKGFSAREIQRSRGRSGPFWQDGYFERALRGSRDAWAAKRYIEENPVRAGMVEVPEAYALSSANRELSEMLTGIQ